MGYSPYPCGIIAFRNDRIRHFVMQKAPYITAIRENRSITVHKPPKHAESDPFRLVIESFGPFILEGSKPGAAAASLYLANKTVPLTMKGHGSIVRASLLAARELYEWLTHWNKMMDFNENDTDYEFVPITEFAPQTNLVVFAIKKKTSSLLRVMNDLTKRVYDQFTIQAELGEREYSYSQPFFLSRTMFEASTYPYESLKPFFKKNRISNPNETYRKYGLEVLRATVMSPYINLMRDLAGQNVVKKFLEEISKVAAESVKKL